MPTHICMHTLMCILTAGTCLSAGIGLRFSWSSYWCVIILEVLAMKPEELDLTLRRMIGFGLPKAILLQILSQIFQS